MALNIPETPENGRHPSKEIQAFAKEFGLDNDPVDKEGKGVDEAAYVARSKSTIKTLLEVMDIQKPE